MNTYIFTDPRFRPLTNAGAIMPGSYLQFFVSQTDDPTPVYGAVPPASPLGTEVDSDGTGMFPVIYMDPNITYRIKLFDADDVLQWDIDPYTPPRDYAPRTVMWFLGTAEQRDAAYPPDLWQVLDGNNGTVDGRDRMPIIAGGDYQAGDVGGALATTTEPDGAHDHGGATDPTVLDETNMPQHNHRLYVRTSSNERGNTRGFGYSQTAGVEGQVIDDAPYGYLDTAPQSGGNELIEPTGEADPDGHDHDIAEQANHSHAIAGGGRPPFVALWAVMRRTS
jgi:hypothetical protein